MILRSARVEFLHANRIVRWKSQVPANGECRQRPPKSRFSSSHLLPKDSLFRLPQETSSPGSRFEPSFEPEDLTVLVREPGGHQQFQQRGAIAKISRNAQQRFSHKWMLVCQSVQLLAHLHEAFDLALESCC